MALTQPTGTVTLAAKAKREKIVFEVPPEAWLVANDITLPRVEERVERWWRTDAALPDRDRRFFAGLKAAWPEPWPDRAFIAAVLYDSPDERAAQTLHSGRFVPTSRDIDDYEGTHPSNPWDWMRVALTKDEMVLVRRSVFFGQAVLGKRFGHSRQLVHKHYREAHERVWYAAICQCRDREHAKPKVGASIATPHHHSLPARG